MLYGSDCFLGSLIWEAVRKLLQRKAKEPRSTGLGPPAHRYTSLYAQRCPEKHRPPTFLELLCGHRGGKALNSRKQTSKACWKGKTGQVHLKRGQRTFDYRGKDYLFRSTQVSMTYKVRPGVMKSIQGNKTKGLLA